MNFSSLIEKHTGANSPFIAVDHAVLVRGKETVFWMTLNSSEPLEDRILQAHLDTEENHGLLNHTIRVRTQRRGCYLKCQFCKASEMLSGKNVPSEQIVAQAAEILKSYLVKPSEIQSLTISTKGLGEPFVNKAVVEAIAEMRGFLPDANFVVSSSGPKAGQPVFDALLGIAGKNVPIDLEFSVHHFDDTVRGHALMPENPKLLWSVSKLSSLAEQWYAKTQRQVRFTIAFGPAFSNAQPIDLGICKELFPPESCVPQLTLLAPKSETQRWNPYNFMPELQRVERMLLDSGYSPLRFFPPGFNEGGSCGTLVDKVAEQELHHIEL